MSSLRRERSHGETGQKWVSIAVAAAVVFAVGWMTSEAPNKSARQDRKDTDAGASAAASAAPASSDGGAPADDLDAGLALAVPSLGALDASLEPQALLPTSGPKTVKLGVVLVTFQGAEGAPAAARTKREALAIAERLGQDARTDFHHAVSGGDTGSADDIGRLPRGVLDPRTEAAVFALAAGEVSDVLETPKGYWIVKRID